MLRLRMNGAASASMRQNGMNYPVNFGLDAASLRELARRYEPSVELADRLWAENSREGRILATLLHPRETFTSAKADQWLVACTVPEQREQLCFNLLQHLDFATEKAEEWVHQSSPILKTGGYTLALRLLLAKKTLPNLPEWIRSANTDRQSEPYQLSLTASRFFERATFVNP